MVRQELSRFRGREGALVGAELLATFDGPARAIRCACAVSTEVQRLGLQTKAGVHTGECRLVGLAVQIGAQIAALAAPNEVLASSTVKDLVAGSGIQYEDRGTRALRGHPEGTRDGWRLFRVVQGARPEKVAQGVDEAEASPP
jgi:class 3 adenylate cyclase